MAEGCEAPRDVVPVRLNEREAQPVRELAEQLPYRSGRPNLSAALRQIISEWAAGRRNS